MKTKFDFPRNISFDLLKGALSVFAPIVVSVFGVFYALFWALSSGPVTMRDELVYKLQSQDGVFSNDVFGNYFHSLVFESALSCGAAFYGCAKVLNLFFFFLFLLAVFGFTRLFLSRGVALWAVALTSLSGVSAYITVFMPEMMYASLLMSSLYAGARAYRSGLFWNYVSAVMLVLASLTKPHAILFLPGFIILWWLAGPIESSVKNRLRTVGTSVFLFFGLRALLGFSFAGIPGLSPIPAGYGGPGPRFDLGTSVMSLVDSEEPIITSGVESSIFQVVTSHLVATSVLIIMLGGPLAILAVRGALFQSSGTETTKSSEHEKRLAFSALMIFGNGIAIGVLSGAYFYETQGSGFEARLMFRYWDFLIPIAAIIGIWAIYKFEEKRMPLTGTAIILLSIAAYFVSVSGFLYRFDFSFTDGAVVRSAASSYTFIVLLILGVSLGISLTLSGLQRAKVAIAAASAIALSVVMVPNWPNLSLDSTSTKAVAAGDYLRTSKLNPDARVGIVASRNFDARSIYFLSELDDANMYFAPTGATLNSTLLAENDFLMVSGTIAIDNDGPWSVLSRGAGFTFLEAKRDNEQRFGIGSPEGNLVNVESEYMLTPDGLVATEIDTYLHFSEPVKGGQEIELSLVLPTSVPDRVLIFTIDGEELPLQIENNDQAQLISLTAPAELSSMTISSSVTTTKTEDGYFESTTGLVLQRIRIGEN